MRESVDDEQVLELAEAHGPIPVLGLGPVIPLLLVALFYAHPLNGLGLSGNNGPEKKGKYELKNNKKLQ